MLLPLALFFAWRFAHHLLAYVWPRPTQPSFRDSVRFSRRVDAALTSGEKWDAFQRVYAQLENLAEYRAQRQYERSLQQWCAAVWQKTDTARHLQVDLLFLTLTLALVAWTVFGVKGTTVAPCQCQCSVAEFSDDASLVANVTGVTMTECRQQAANDASPYCYASEKWQAPACDFTEAGVWRPRQSNWQRQFFTDASGEHYVVVYAARDDPTASSGLTLFSVQRLTRTDACLCAWQLGVQDNVSLLAHNGWHLMPDVSVVRNTTGAALLHTPCGVAYYESFTVEFTEPQARLDDMTRAQLTDFNTRLAKRDLFILKRWDNAALKRVRVTLSGAQAACFTQCRLGRVAP